MVLRRAMSPMVLSSFDISLHRYISTPLSQNNDILLVFSLDIHELLKKRLFLGAITLWALLSVCCEASPKTSWSNIVSYSHKYSSNTSHTKGLNNVFRKKYNLNEFFIFQTGCCQGPCDFFWQRLYGHWMTKTISSSLASPWSGNQYAIANQCN